MLKSKKGFMNVEEIFFVLVFLFGSALFLFILYYTYGEIKDPINDALRGATPDGDATFNYTSFSGEVSGGVGSFNTLYPFLLIGLIVMVIISAFTIQSHPVFFFVSIILLGVVILLGSVFSNIFQQITTNENFGTTEDNFNIVSLIMENLPLIITVIVFLTLIVMWAKPGGSSTPSL